MNTDSLSVFAHAELCHCPSGCAHGLQWVCMDNDSLKPEGPLRQLHLAAERPIKILGSMAGFAAYFLVQVHNLLAGNSKQY